jgi:hypothetical protein
MTLQVLENIYCIYRFDIGSELPPWIYQSEFYSVTKTNDEISVVTLQKRFNEKIKCSKNWKILKVEGPLDFSLVGIIADISRILKEVNIPIFTISTFDTDYILLGKADLDKGVNALRGNGYTILPNSAS